MSNLEKMISEATLPYFVRSTDEAKPRLAFYVDNHLIQTFMWCQRKFQLQHILRQRLKGPGGMAMSIGGWWSAVLEDFYNQIKTVQLVNSIGAPQDALASANALVGRYPTFAEFVEAAAKRWREAKMDELAVARPKAYKEFGGAAGAALMATQYYDGQGKLDFNGWKIVGAEKGFGQRGEVLLYEDSDIVVYYMGKPDLVVIDNCGRGELQPVEHKTIHRIPKNIQVKYKPHPQIMGYVYSLDSIAKSLGYDKRVDRCIVNVAARALPAEKPRDGVKKPRFVRVFPHYSESELLEWRDNTVKKVRLLHKSLINDSWVWNEGPNTCHLYGGCEYRGIDARPAGMREMVMKSDYITIEPWTPYVIEDEDDGEEG